MVGKGGHKAKSASGAIASGGNLMRSSSSDIDGGSGHSDSDSEASFNELIAGRAKYRSSSIHSDAERRTAQVDDVLSEYHDSEIDDIFIAWAPAPVHSVDKGIENWIPKANGQGMVRVWDSAMRLPRVVVQQKNGCFLNKVVHDKICIDTEKNKKKSQDEQVVLILNSKKTTYIQPKDLVKDFRDKGFGDDSIGHAFSMLGIEHTIDYDHQKIDKLTLVQNPKDPHRLIDIADLMRDNPDIMIMAHKVFLQNHQNLDDDKKSDDHQNLDDDKKSDGGRPGMTGNFSNMAHRLTTTPEHRVPLLPEHRQLMDLMKRATLDAMSRPNFEWTPYQLRHFRAMKDTEIKRQARILGEAPDALLQEHLPITERAWFSLMKISDTDFSRMKLRVTYQVRTRTPSISESSDEELPYQVARGVGSPVSAVVSPLNQGKRPRENSLEAPSKKSCQDLPGRGRGDYRSRKPRDRSGR